MQKLGKINGKWEIPIQRFRNRYCWLWISKKNKIKSKTQKASGLVGRCLLGAGLTLGSIGCESPGTPYRSTEWAVGSVGLQHLATTDPSFTYEQSQSFAALGGLLGILAQQEAAREAAREVKTQVNVGTKKDLDRATNPVMTREGRKLRTMSGPHMVEPLPAENPHLLLFTQRKGVISPDGTQISYIGPDEQLWKVPLSGGNPLQLTNTPSPRDKMHPSWSPDGQYILYASDECDDLRQMAPMMIVHAGIGMVSSYISVRIGEECGTFGGLNRLGL